MLETRNGLFCQKLKGLQIVVPLDIHKYQAIGPLLHLWCRKSKCFPILSMAMIAKYYSFKFLLLINDSVLLIFHTYGISVRKLSCTSRFKRLKNQNVGVICKICKFLKRILLQLHAWQVSKQKLYFLISWFRLIIFSRHDFVLSYLWRQRNSGYLGRFQAYQIKFHIKFFSYFTEVLCIRGLFFNTPLPIVHAIME